MNEELLLKIITKEQNRELWRQYMKESTRNVRGMRRHENRKNSNRKTTRIPHWTAYQNSLDSLHFNRLDFSRLTGSAPKRRK